MLIRALGIVITCAIRAAAGMNIVGVLLAKLLNVFLQIFKIVLNTEIYRAD